MANKPDCTSAHKLMDKKCLGYQLGNDDEPMEKCINCPQYNMYEEWKEDE